MAGVNESIDLSGLANTLAGGAAGIDWRPALKRCAVAARASFLENFEQESSPDGVKWPPLKRQRRRKRDKRGRRRGGTQKLLQDSGLLKASSTASGADAILDIQPLSLETGTALVYAAAQNYGYAPRNLPARQFIGVNADLADTFAEIIGDYAVEVLGG